MNFFATLAKGLFFPIMKWNRCNEHNIPFPKGAKCPKCKSEEINNGTA